MAAAGESQPLKDAASVVEALRAGGSVFAEDEASLLLAAAHDADDLATLLSRRLRGEPLEHVVGSVVFGGVTLRVGAGMFVPRQRSVQLATLTVAECRRRQPATMLELCCGVAPLAATVERADAAERAVASDHDERCVAVARENLRTPYVFVGDLFDAIPQSFRHGCDVVAVVPPYVPAGEAHLLAREARDHEPPEALYGGADGLNVVRRILANVAEWLAPGGTLLIEMHKVQAQAAIDVAAAADLAAHSQVAHDGQTCLLSVCTRLGPGVVPSRR
jgi:release factor glutamine methyltransferase